MPAIQLARLNRQIAELSEAFYQPKRYLQTLHDLLEAYHDRSYRSGQTGPPPPLLPRTSSTLSLSRLPSHFIVHSSFRLWGV